MLKIYLLKNKFEDIVLFFSLGLKYFSFNSLFNNTGMQITKFYLVFTFFISFIGLNAQGRVDNKNHCPSILNNANNAPFLDSITFDKKGNRYRFLNGYLPYVAGDFYRKYRTSFGLTPNDSFALIDIKDNSKGNVQILKYQHFYKGIKVENSIFVEDLVDCLQFVLHGFVANTLAGTSLSFVSETYKTNAINFINNLRPNDTTVAITPVFANVLDEDCTFKLYFKMSLAQKGGNRPRNQDYAYVQVYLDPTQNSIDGVFSLFAAAAIAPGLFGEELILEDSPIGDQVILTDAFRKITTESAHEAEPCPFFGICPPVAYKGGQVEGVTKYIRNPNQNWFIYVDQFLFFGEEVYNQASFQIHHHARLVWDYFFETFKLKGPGTGKNTELYIITNGERSIAQLTGGINETQEEAIMVTFADATSLFIVAHEYTHTLMNRGRGPARIGRESLALNEGFCDIFGSLISNTYVGAGRSLSNPPATGGIDHITNLGLASNSHAASGIISKVYFLLRQGGVHRGLSILPIGKVKSQTLFFDIMLNKLNGEVSFLDAKNASITTAIELFGPCSWELREVTNAWASVGLGQPFDESSDWASGNYVRCKEDGVAQFSWSACYGTGANNNAPYTWEIFGLPPSGVTWTTSGPNNSVFTLIFTSYESQLTERFRLIITSPNGKTSVVWLTIKDCNGDNPNPCDGNAVVRSKKQRAEPNDASWSIYPNPVNDRLYISSTNGDIHAATYQIYNTSGMVIQSGSTSNHIDVTQLPTAVYVLRVQTKDGVFKYKFVKY